MALVHIDLLGLRGKDLRCVGSTVIVVAFFTWAFFLTLTSSHHPTQSSEPPLPQSKVVRERAIRAPLGPSIAENNNQVSLVNTSVANGHGQQNSQDSDKLEKTAKKAKHIFKRVGHEKEAEHSMRNAAEKEAGHGKRDFADTTEERRKIEERVVAGQTNTHDRSENSDAYTQPNYATGQITTDDQNKNTESVTMTEKNDITQSISKPSPVLAEDSTHVKKTQAVWSVQDVASLPVASSRFKTPLSNLASLPLLPFSSPFIVPDSPPRAKVDKKTITWFRPPNARDLNRHKRILKGCPEPRCKLVYPLPSDLLAHAVVFSQTDLTMGSAPPVRTHSDQVLVLHAMTPPAPWPRPALPPDRATTASLWTQAFNWTWSYRRDSDVWQPFGRLRPADTVPSLERLASLVREKTHPVAWIPRTCPAQATPSARDQFVRELGKHVNVTEFGSCSNTSCSEDNASCTEVLSQRFFFLLAFEDDLCPDYVTEVFYRAWQEGTYVIPVVRGGADYAEFFPDGTYVDADWFDTARQLADFLREVIADDTLFTQLLWRKAHWKASRRSEEAALCHLCYKLHHLEAHRRVYPDIQDWLDTSACKRPDL